MFIGEILSEEENNTTKTSFDSAREVRPVRPATLSSRDSRSSPKSHEEREITANRTRSERLIPSARSGYIANEPTISHDNQRSRYAEDSFRRKRRHGDMTSPSSSHKKSTLDTSHSSFDAQITRSPEVKKVPHRSLERNERGPSPDAKKRNKHSSPEPRRKTRRSPELGSHKPGQSREPNLSARGSTSGSSIYEIPRVSESKSATRQSSPRHKSQKRSNIGRHRCSEERSNERTK